MKLNGKNNRQHPSKNDWTKRKHFYRHLTSKMEVCPLLLQHFCTDISFNEIIMKTLTFLGCFFFITITKTAFRAKSQSVDLFLVFISVRAPHPSLPSPPPQPSPPLGFLRNMHSSSNFPPPWPPASLHSSLSFSAYLTAMATGDVLARTQMRLRRITGCSAFVRRHVRRQSPHVCFVAELPSQNRTIPWANMAVKGGTEREDVWKWAREKREVWVRWSVDMMEM